ncbi:MAG: enoyl-CoA hydratase-related protein, partial [Gammaproteobacteria bacterium]
GRKIRESIDLASGEYRPSRTQAPELPEHPVDGPLRGLIDSPSDLGRFAWRVVSETLNYSAGLVPEIARDLADIDRAMRLGFNWQSGPFEMIDRIGIDTIDRRMRADGKDLKGLLQIAGPMYRTERGILEQKNPNGGYSPVPPLPGVLSLADIKRAGDPLLENAAASLWDIRDGIVCFEMHTAMNSVNPEVLDLLQRSIDLTVEQFKALVIYHEGPHFSVGANLKLLLSWIESENWSQIEAFIRRGQQVYQALKTAPVPVVGAPSGLALGGGAEILLHCDAIQAHIELQMGLVEAGVGLIPGWGGCTEMVFRNHAADASSGDGRAAATKTFSLIAERRVSQSAEIARELNFLRPSDAITMNRDRLLADAKAKALDLARQYRPPEKGKTTLVTAPRDTWLPAAFEQIEKSKPVSDYERIILERLAAVLSSESNQTPLDEETLLEREVENFLFLVRQPQAEERIRFMLRTGKPLAN